MSSEGDNALRPSGRRSLGYLVTGTVLAQSIQFAASILLARLYTPAEFGQYASILAIASVIGALTTLSYPTAIPLAEDDEESRVVAWLAVGLAAALASVLTVVLAAGVVVGVEAWGWRPGWQHVVFVPLTSLAIAVWGTLQFRQSRLSAFYRIATATSSGATTQAGTQLVMGWSGAGAVGLSLGYLMGRCVNVAVLLRGARLGRVPGLHRLRATASRWSQMPRWQLPTTVLNLLGTSAITPWIARQYGLDSAGAFAFALQMLSVPAALVGQAVAIIAFPRLAEADRGSGIPPAAVEAYVRRLSSVSLPLFLPVLALGPELFAVIFGSDWTQAGRIAAILSPYLAVSLVASPISSIPIVKRRLGTILTWAAADTSARFAAISVGGVVNSAMTGFALYSAVSTLSVCGYLVWTLRLSGVSPASMLRASWLAALLAVGTILVLIWAQSALSREALYAFALTLSATWALVALRKLSKGNPPRIANTSAE